MTIEFLDCHCAGLERRNHLLHSRVDLGQTMLQRAVGAAANDARLA